MAEQCQAWDLLASLEELAELLRERSLYDHGAVGVGVLCTELCLEADQPLVAQKAWDLVEEQLNVLGVTDTETEMTRRINALREWSQQRKSQQVSAQPSMAEP